jgi:hypothetical protein
MPLQQPQFLVPHTAMDGQKEGRVEAPADASLCCRQQSHFLVFGECAAHIFTLSQHPDIRCNGMPHAVVNHNLSDQTQLNVNTATPCALFLAFALVAADVLGLNVGK